MSECLFSVDIETSGLDPEHHSILSIGATPIDDPGDFYALVRPIPGRTVDPEAMEINQLDIEFLRKAARNAVDICLDFSKWVKSVAKDRLPILVGLGAHFDASFLEGYFRRFLLKWPFHYAPLDIKSYYYALTQSAWTDTAHHKIPAYMWGDLQITHNAHHDAKAQAQLFRFLRSQSQGMRQLSYGPLV